ncbi:hypothetical protein [Aureimonas phyllosphaerae]|uniref:Uncharacterized protein n=1 Tax=Aureimonas phyllosphaerae TaxID=1166078 RepID=A0A7W6BT19_9HYPH|nr:hypothetical protein [Aureimonas phyllosphaerae]MBB3935529.1 hypothetical protein [Aureimonas phyllosphaerae]MBB3959537.1 hypothetical protein [Aureimonas phyllosphaerae]
MMKAANFALTRDDMVRMEGEDAARSHRTRRDNPYRPGSADWRAWCNGFEAVR